MVWIKNNNILNPRVTSLPAVVGSHYAEGSIVTVEGAYGVVEWKIINGTWVAVRALTDLTFFVDPTGIDSLVRGSEALPLKTLRYVTKTLIPKQVRNVSIRVTSVDLPDNEDYVGELTDIIKTEDTDTISITGWPVVTIDDNIIELTNSGYIYNGRLRKYSTEAATGIHELVYSGGVETLGSDPNRNQQYIAWSSLDFADSGIRGGQVIYNTSTSASAFITELAQDGQSYMYLSTPIFTNDTDSFEIVSLIPELSWVRSMSANINFPVVAGDKSSIYMLNGNTVPGSGEYRGVLFQKISLMCYNVDVNIRLNQLEIIDTVTEEGTFDSMFSNCSRLIISNEVQFNMLRMDVVPEFITNRSLITDQVDISQSQTSNPKSYWTTGVADIDSLYDPSNRVDSYATGILFYTTIFSITMMDLYKSLVTIKNCMIDYVGHSDNTDITVVSATDSYLRMDYENIVMNCNVIDYPGSATAFGKFENGVIDNRQGDILVFNSPTLLNDTDMSTSGIYKYQASVIYDEIDQLFAVKFVTDGTIGISKDAPGNIYIRVNNKWVVRAGNQYTTEEFESLIDNINIIVPNGLEIFNTTIGREMTWIEPSQGT